MRLPIQPGTLCECDGWDSVSIKSVAYYPHPDGNLTLRIEFTKPTDHFEVTLNTLAQAELSGRILDEVSGKRDREVDSG